VNHGIVAHHLKEAGHLDRARFHFFQAAESADFSGSSIEVVNYLSKAFVILPSEKPDSIKEGHFRLLLGDSHYSLGKYDKSVENINLGLKLVANLIRFGFGSSSGVFSLGMLVANAVGSEIISAKCRSEGNAKLR